MKSRQPPSSTPPPSQPISNYQHLKNNSYADRIGVASIETLAMSGPGASTKIAEYLTDPNHKVRARAVDVLASFGKKAEPAVGRISQLVGHIDLDIRTTATKALALIESKAAIRVLKLARKDQDPAVRAWAHGGLAKLDGDCEHHMEEVADILKEGKMKDPCQAADSMAWMSCANQDVVQALIETMDQDDEHHRAAAARSITHIGPLAHAAVPALMKSLSDNSLQVRQATLLGLASMKDKAAPAVPLLIGMLQDPAPRFRELAAHALGTVGSQALSAVDALQKATLDPQARVQAAAKRALAGILGD